MAEHRVMSRHLLGMTHYRSKRRYESHATEKKTTNLVCGSSSTAICLLETRLRRAESRNPIRERLSRIKIPRNLADATQGLGGSQKPSFARAEHPRDRREELRCFRNPVTCGTSAPGRPGRSRGAGRRSG